MINLLNKSKYFLIFIFVLAFSLRLGYAFLEKVAPYIDAVGFDEIGKHLAQGKGYRLCDGLIEDDRTLTHPPVYPFFLGIIYKIFGYSHPAVWIIQSLIGAFICILIYLIAKNLFNPKIARISALVSTVCFAFIMYSAILFSETVFLFLVLLSLICLYKAEVSNRSLRYIIAGILAGLTTLTRPIILPFFLCFSLVGFRKNIKARMLFLIPLILLVSSWVIRNYYVYHSFIPISSGAGETFWCGHHPEASGRYDMPDEGTPGSTGQNLSEAEPSGQEYIRRDNLGYRLGLQFIIEHPLRTTVLELNKVSLFFNLFRTDIWWPHIKGIERVFFFILSLLFNLFIFSFGITGIVFSYMKTDRYISWIRRFIYISILSLIPFVIEARYRLTILPFMIIFSCYGLVLLPKIRLAFKLKDKKIMRLSYISVLLFNLILLSSLYDLFMCRDEAALRLHFLVSGLPTPW